MPTPKGLASRRAFWRQPGHSQIGGGQRPRALLQTIKIGALPSNPLVCVCTLFFAIFIPSLQRWYFFCALGEGRVEQRETGCIIAGFGISQDAVWFCTLFFYTLVLFLWFVGCIVVKVLCLRWVDVRSEHVVAEFLSNRRGNRISWFRCIGLLTRKIK